MEEIRPWDMEKKTFLMLMHLSQFAGFILPFGGLILPIIMWATNKDKSQEIDDHGKVILNWVISSLIYIAISLVLTVVLVGAIGLFVVGICAIVFTIIGAIKANEGKLWVYPLSIKFFKISIPE